MSCVHLEETDFYVLILWCEEKKRGCVGVKYEDWYILLSAGLQREFFSILLLL